MAVVSKADLPRLARLPVGAEAVPVSAARGDGLPELRARLLAALPGRDLPDGPALLRERHHEALTHVVASADRARGDLSTGNHELAAASLGEALRQVGEMLGESVAEDVLDRIFLEFCIGK